MLVDISFGRPAAYLMLYVHNFGCEMVSTEV